MSPKVVDKDQKRREILRAATREVARRGIRGVTVTDIARAAGMGKGTVYDYFSGKEEIYAAMIREYMERAETAAAREMFRARSAKEKLEALLAGWLKSTETESHDFMMLFLDVWTEAIRGTNEELARAFDFKGFVHQYRDYVASILQEGVDAGELRSMDTHLVAGSLLGMFDGIMLQWLLHREVVDVKATVDTALQIVWNGLSAE